MKLTLPQQDIYFEQLLHPGDPIYNIGAKIEIQGLLLPDVLKSAYKALIDQHDAYRITIDSSTLNCEVSILDTHQSELDFIDFSADKEAQVRANSFMQETFKKPFEFKVGELLHRFILIKVDDRFHYLFSVYHHIITDGWGTSLMFQRLVRNYNELCECSIIKTEYPYSYKNFIIDDEEYENSDAYLKDKAYWKERLSHLPENLFEKRGKGVPGNKSARKELIVERNLYNQLSDVARQLGSSTFHIVLSVIYLYFGRTQQNNAFAVGLPVLNRNKSIFKKTVGLFMGVSPLLIHFDFENTFQELVKKVREQLRTDYRHQRFPLGKIIQELGLFDEKQRLFNVTLSYEKQNYADHFKDTITRVIPLTHESERVALALYIREFDEAEPVKIDFDYNLSYFDEEAIDKIVAHFHYLLEQVCEDSGKRLLDFQYLQAPEEKQLVHDFNQTQFQHPKHSTLLSLFRKKVEDRPEHLAVKDSTSAYTYKQLDALSDKVASYLSNKIGDYDQLPVAVLMDRSALLIVTLLGVLKSGRAYIPLDPNFPQERIHYIVAHSQVKYIVGQSDLTIPSIGIKVVNIDIILKSDHPEYLKPLDIKPTDTAYIIYTSGSTGNPKGVAVGHISLVNFLLSMQQKPGLGENDSMFSVTTQSFDISLLEFFVPLISGATLYVAHPDILKDPLAVIEELSQIRPTIIQATPSFYQMLYNAGWVGNNALKILCGGDLLNADLAKRLIDTCGEVWNMYGPTETTIWSSIKQIKVPEEASNIGSPIHNTQIYILDNYIQLLPVNSAGTIYIGGDGLAQGYYHDKQLTDMRFVNNPFNTDEKIYNTGDIGRWNKNGEIEFLGRSDHQVKVRGYRVELGEIETKLNHLSTIDSSVVVVRKNEAQEAHLVAYVVLAEYAETLNVQEIIRYLRRELPEYMIPSTIIPLNSFPLTPNHKIDRKSLSSQEISLNETQSAYKEPKTAMEIMLCKYCQEVLGLPYLVGVSDHFFFLGGHSLNAVKLIGKIEQQLGYHLTLKDIFEHPVVESLAAFLTCGKAQKLNPIIPVAEQNYYPVTQPQHAIWLASLQDEKSVAYNMFMAFQVEGELEKDILQKVFEEVITKYEVLRTNFFVQSGYPHQKIASVASTNFKIDSFSVENNEETGTLLQDYVNQKFDLEAQLLLRVGLFTDTSGSNILTFVTHHIIMDGWSLEVLIKEIIGRYKAYITKNTFKDSKLSFQFKDYSVWQKVEETKKQDLNFEFWSQYLASYRGQSLIPYDLELPETKNSGTFYHFNWSSHFLEELERTAQRQHITLHTLLVSAFYAVIYKMQGNKDICIGTINSGRPYADLHDQMGMFVKTLPLRVTLDSDQSFLALTHAIQKDLLAIDKHQDISQEIFSTIKLEAILVLQNPTFDYETINIHEGLVLKSHFVNPRYNRLPMLINFSINENKIHGSIHYDTSKYQGETIEIMVMKYKKVLEEIIMNADVPLYAIDTDLPFEKEESIEIDFNF